MLANPFSPSRSVPRSTAARGFAVLTAIVASDDSEGTGAPRLESRIREHASADDLERAVTVAIEGYGPELLGYLHAMAPTATEADDLFSELCERVWRGLPKFRWDSSFRTWAYTIARNLLRDRHRARSGPEGKLLGLGDASEVSKVAQQVRTSTAIYLKTEAKTRLQQIRDALDPDDRTLLILRVDRRLAWRDIANIMAEGNEDAGDIGKLTTRLRKRFERIKERLRDELAKDD
jgi:RNA polymerase sigma-70 factor (ECF subfamily)